jgi:hypothetical protein
LHEKHDKNEKIVQHSSSTSGNVTFKSSIDVSTIDFAADSRPPGIGNIFESTNESIIYVITFNKLMFLTANNLD